MSRKTLNPKRITGPISDGRAIDDETAPKHNTLYAPRGSALDQKNVNVSQGNEEHDGNEGKSVRTWNSRPVSYKTDRPQSTGAIVTPLDVVTPGEGETIVAKDGSHGLILNPDQSLEQLKISFPSNPVDGQKFSIHSTRDMSNVTYTGAFAEGNNPAEAIKAGVSTKYIYSTGLRAWLH